MNVLLIHPRYSFLLKSFQDISLQDIPLNLAYIAASLERAGHHVRILDMNVAFKKGELRELVRNNTFEVLGFTSTTPVVPTCYKTIKAFKKAYPHAKVILGGWHASTLPRDTMNECLEIDYVIKGEGEEAMVELLQEIQDGKPPNTIKGLIFRETNGDIVETEERPLIKDLDSIPFPARHLLPYNLYKKRGFYTVGGYFKRDVNTCRILTSRGCANKCTFCADHVINKNRCRFRSAENVVAEIEEMVKKHNIRVIFFNDEDFMLSPKRVLQICQLIIERKIKIAWACMARVDSVKQDVLEAMKKAGCIRVSFGIESGSPRILAAMHKNVKISQVRNAVKITRAVGIPIYGYFVFGMPSETVDDLRMTRQLIMELKPDFITHSMAIPYPGTELFSIAKREGYLSNERDWALYSYFFNNKIMKFPGYQEIVNYQRKILRDFYTSPTFLCRTMKNVKTIWHIAFYLRGFKDFIEYMLTPI